MISRFEPSDIIGLAAIVGCLVLIALGKNGTTSSILLIIVGYYFGANTKPRRK